MIASILIALMTTKLSLMENVTNNYSYINHTNNSVIL